MTDNSFDKPLWFTLPDRGGRGRVLRMAPVLDEILQAHDYPLPVKHVLAEAVTLAALLGSLMKSDTGQLTMQAQAKNGAIELLVADYKNGELRGHAKFDAELAAALGPNASLSQIFGEGYLAITFDRFVPETGENERYQGIVPLEGASLASACEYYFQQSEQIPTRIKLAVRCDANTVASGGLLLQHLPEGEEGRERLHIKLDDPDWEHIAILADSLTYAELLDQELMMEDIVWRLYHEENVRVDSGKPVSRGCRCTKERYQVILQRFSEEERADMRNEAGDIVVDCAFCSRAFAIDGL
ncbi:Hsp33 family molecular chaperone HslO [Parasphingorhabdus sp. DH2-15]|uniref:Hsp33 family molecular chaperone HslO n=1 Tax=Parasphingorhabdus sp. DH2-15 TaxID=3444112 RepID=UPI003F687049